MGESTTGHFHNICRGKQLPILQTAAVSNITKMISDQPVNRQPECNDTKISGHVQPD